jgi:hypothetical protein
LANCRARDPSPALAVRGSRATTNATLRHQLGMAWEERAWNERSAGYLELLKWLAAVRPSPRRRRDNLRGCILDDADSSSERVDPLVEPASLAGEDGWIAEGVGEQCTALIGSEKAHGEVARVASAQCPELLLCPLDRNAH